VTVFRADIKLPSKERRGGVIVRHRTVADYAYGMVEGERINPRSGLSQEFCATRNAAEYNDMLTNGWPDAVEGVEGLDGLTSDEAPRPGFVRDVGGSFPIVPAYLAGHPASMLACRALPSETVRGLTLVIDGCYNGGIDTDKVLNYARCCMRLVAWLQAEQIDTSIYVVNASRLAGPGTYLYVTPVHESGQIPQPERIAAILHPSFLRRAWHQMLNYEDSVLHLPGSCSGAGHPTSANAAELRDVLPEAFSIVMLPHVGTGNPDAAIKEAINLKLRRTE